MASTRMSRWGADLYTGHTSYALVANRRRWYTISAVVLVISIALLGARSLNPSIEFKGGSEFTVADAAVLGQQPAIDAVASVKSDEVPRVSTVGKSSIRVQTSKLDEAQTVEVAQALATGYDVPLTNISKTFIGPTWGADVSSKALRALVVFLVLVTLVMTIYFRAWRMAVAALVALLHDLVITVGLYAGVGWEVSPATVIGFLTILGYSIYDTVVVFDKVRENTEKVTEQRRFTYGELANLAVNQTLVRSINTSVVALLPVTSILFVGTFILGAGTLRDISLALFVGMLVGTFSSIFLATPLEVTLREREPRMQAHSKKVHALREQAAVAGTGTEAAALAGVAAYGAHLLPGQHLGTAAQPKRRKTAKK